jgi:hypothetical protein
MYALVARSWSEILFDVIRSAAIFSGTRAGVRGCHCGADARPPGRLKAAMWDYLRLGYFGEDGGLKDASFV